MGYQRLWSGADQRAGSDSRRRGDLYAHEPEHDGPLHTDRTLLPEPKHRCGNQRQRKFELTDFGTARGRAGYVIGNFLPYGFVGMAVGRASYSVSTLADVTQNTSKNARLFLRRAPVRRRQPAKTFFLNSAGQNNALLWGYTVGGGLDWALTPNFFLRGEFEFVQFAPISNIAVSVSSGRVGAGFKF